MSPSMRAKDRDLMCVHRLDEKYLQTIALAPFVRRGLKAFTYLDSLHWRPKAVKLFFFGMSRSFSHGNDFVDNYNYSRWLHRQQTKSDAVEASVETPLPAPKQQASRRNMGFCEYVISWQTAILENVHLMRRVKYHWGPLLRTMVLAEPDEQMRSEALLQTKKSLEELDELSRRMGFEYEVYLLVPAHDILMGTHGGSLDLLNRVAVKPVVSTAQLFGESPGQFYFSYDGHLNPKGSRRVAELLIARENERPSR